METFASFSLVFAFKVMCAADIRNDSIFLVSSSWTISFTPNLCQINAHICQPSCVVYHSVPHRILISIYRFMDKRMMLKLNGGRTVAGILRGFDPFMNVVIDETVEECRDGTRNNIGMVVSNSS